MSAAFAVWLVLQLVVFLGGVVLILGGAHGSGRMHEVAFILLVGWCFGAYWWLVASRYLGTDEVPRYLHITLHLVIACSLAMFQLASTVDPGTISAATPAADIIPYAFDGIMYRNGQQCKSCKIPKPARSKHCRLCNRCVQRFDHHCYWVDNCIGARNYIYFLGYLATLVAMSGLKVWLFLGGIRAHIRWGVDVDLERVMEMHYLPSPSSAPEPMNVSRLLQYLVIRETAVSCTFLFVLFTFPILTFFSWGHFRLAMANITTNENVKQARIEDKEGGSVGRPELYSRGSALANLAEIVRLAGFQR